MAPESVLLAEPDQRSLYILAEVLSERIPGVVIDMCNAVDQLRHKVERTSYDTIAVSPMLLDSDRFLIHPVWPQHSVPLLMTVSHRDLALAHTAFAGKAFDLIVKPIVP